MDSEAVRDPCEGRGDDVSALLVKALEGAAALEMGKELEGMVTYDLHLVEGAHRLRIGVLAPM